MARRRCPHQGCPALVPYPGPRYCPTHSREREQKRGYSNARGYDRHYRAARARAARLVEAGQATCWRCGKPIEAGETFDLGHVDDARSIIRGPEHVFCNRSGAGKAAHKYDRTDMN
nr:MAG TPA: HNH endonuclease bacteriophage, HNH Endonuclease, DNA.52A [Caudoviricetes sp.]